MAIVIKPLAKDHSRKTLFRENFALSFRTKVKIKPNIFIINQKEYIYSIYYLYNQNTYAFYLMKTKCAVFGCAHSYIIYYKLRYVLIKTFVADGAIFKKFIYVIFQSLVYNEPFNFNRL